MKHIIDIVSRPSFQSAGPYPEELIPDSTDYVGYFRNDCGEELVFIQRKGQEVATLVHSDLGWEPVQVMMGRCYEVILNGDEKEWVATCWKASAGYRPDESRDVAPDLPFDVMVGCVKAGVSMQMVTELAKTGQLQKLLNENDDLSEATCKHCGHPIIQSSGTKWFHVAGMNRGCRASSYERLGTWDDELDRKWTATPKTAATLS